MEANDNWLCVYQELVEQVNLVSSMRSRIILSKHNEKKNYVNLVQQLYLLLWLEQYDSFFFDIST